MKKKVLLLILISLVFSAIIVSAASNSTDASTAAYSCLTNKVNNHCSDLSTEEKIFSALAIGKCKTELNSEALNGECWPASSCKLKTTAQAILAVGTNTKKSEDWLLSRTISFENINWFLQVESANATNCKATYSGVSYDFSINGDRTLSRDAGTCLTLYSLSGGNYWFKISPNCYNQEFQISCTDSFITSLLYQKINSPKYYISDKTHSASGAGTTSEKIDAKCFAEGNVCDYEGSLWATLVLKFKKHDVSAYMPYLISMADENEKYLPESFLQSLTNTFKTDLLKLQKESKFWSVSGNQFYDTALALLPFQNQELQEKTNSKNWLKEVQDTDGCWNSGNIRDTAFLLYSLWPKTVSSTDTTPSVKGCVSSGYFCLSNASCSSVSGNELSDYSGCFGTTICCSKDEPAQTCNAQDGELCRSDEICLGGNTIDSADSNSAKFCCVGGTCEQSGLTECEQNSGFCRSSCVSGEKSSAYDCSSSQICCITAPANYLWLIILLVVLIILAALGIIFRKQLKDLLMKLKFRFKFGKGKASATMTRPVSRMPMTPTSRIYPGAVQRKIITTTTTTKAPGKVPAKTIVKKTTKTVKTKKKDEYEDVLKKLKEIGK
jgi:hypothetical protein